MPPEVENLKKQVDELQKVVMLMKEKQDLFLLQDRYLWHRDIEMFNGKNIRFGLSIGTKIGTATNQKLAFYGVTPIVQPGSIAAPSTPSGSYVQAEAQSAVNAINSIRTALQNLGLIA